MAQNLKMWSILLLIVQLFDLPQPTPAFGHFGGHRGGSGQVAEILAAGLITRLLMEEYKPVISSPILHTLRHGILGGYHLELPRSPLMVPRMPMMHPYGLPPMMHRPNFYMNQQLLHQAHHQARHQALTSSLNQELRALEASESLLDAYLAIADDSDTSSLEELLSEEDSLPSAAMLLGSSDMLSSGEKFHDQTEMAADDAYQTASSETESRYILPRIARYFVQRLLRRAENH